MATLTERSQVCRPTQARRTWCQTVSLCPQCLAAIPAELAIQDGRMLMYKDCPEHGRFSDLISSDAEFFIRLERLSHTVEPLAGRHACDRQEPDSYAGPAGCPTSCGLCERHLSRTMMLNIDLTNRCNLRCPICFANADARGYVYEISRERVNELMSQVLAAGEPRPPCIQFSGGEPTLHPEFLDIIHDARKAGFAQIQIASNGIRLASQPDFARACADAGLNIVYLQFDGLSDEIYRRTRNAPLLDLKLRAVEKIYAAGMRTMLVPTIIKGFNDHQVGPILRYAVDNIDKITGISWQPVSFTGRIDHAERLRQRFTLADLARCIDEQTGWVDMGRDWYPYSFVEPFCKLVEAITGEPVVHTTCHSHCGMATYLIVNPVTREVVPIPKMVEVEPLMAQIDRLASRIVRWPWLRNRWHLSLAMGRLRRYYHPEEAPTGWDFESLATFLESFVSFGQQFPDNDARRRDTESKPWRALLLAAMHFQDAYNFEVDRVRRCVIHYAAPDGRLYPFCTYNCGPFFRARVEEQYAQPSRPVREQRQQRSQPVAPATGGRD